MKLYTVDAFTDVEFGGNPAGVALFEDSLPSDEEMKAVARDVGYSETAFVLPLKKSEFKIRYFTPVEEVPLCGHATVGAFALLLGCGMISEGERCTAHVGAGEIKVDVSGGLVWLDMAKPNELFSLSESDAEALLSMFALPEGAYGALRPAAVDAGLPDIMMPVASRELLSEMKPDLERISALSAKLHVTGVHAFAFGDGAAGYCRNFAPLYGIDEEAATGTSNGALTYYLYNRGRIEPGELNLFVQGEAMGKPSKIYSRLEKNGDGSASIRVGGSGVIRA